MRLIWIKTPKTGGTAIKLALQEKGLYSRSFENTKGENGFPISVVFTRNNTIKKNHPQAWSNCIKFAVARNPYDKFVSAWKYLKLTKNHSLVDTLSNLPQKNVNKVEWFHMTQTQLDAMCDHNGHFMPDVVLKYENLEAELNTLLVQNNYTPITLKRENVGERDRNWDVYMDKREKQMIYNKYITDFKFFNYKK